MADPQRSCFFVPAVIDQYRDLGGVSNNIFKKSQIHLCFHVLRNSWIDFIKYNIFLKFNNIKMCSVKKLAALILI